MGERWYRSGRADPSHTFWRVNLTQEQTEILQDLKEWVAIRIDEVMPEGAAPLGPIQNLDKELDEAALKLLRMVPRELAYPAGKSAESIVPLRTNTGRGIIVCPADFVRFLRVTMSHWRRPVDTLLAVDSVKYRKMDAPYIGATKDNPAAALSPGMGLPNDAAYSVEVAPHEKGALAHLVYVPWLKAYEIPEVLRDPLVWLTAHRVLTILRQMDSAGAAFTQMQLSIQRQFTGLIGEEMPSIIQPPRQ